MAFTPDSECIGEIDSCSLEQQPETLPSLVQDLDRAPLILPGPCCELGLPAVFSRVVVDEAGNIDIAGTCDTKTSINDLVDELIKKVSAKNGNKEQAALNALGAEAAPRLIAHLSDADFKSRDAAYKALESMGAAALAALGKEQSNASPETRHKVDRLISKIAQPELMVEKHLAIFEATAFGANELKDAHIELQKKVDGYLTHPELASKRIREMKEILELQQSGKLTLKDWQIQEVKNELDDLENIGNRAAQVLVSYAREVLSRDERAEAKPLLLKALHIDPRMAKDGNFLNAVLRHYLAGDKQFMDAFTAAGGDADKLNSMARARGSARWAASRKKP